MPALMRIALFDNVPSVNHQKPLCPHVSLNDLPYRRRAAAQFPLLCHGLKAQRADSMRSRGAPSSPRGLMNPWNSRNFPWALALALVLEVAFCQDACVVLAHLMQTRLACGGTIHADT